jgi:hypothetical protein
MSSYSMRLAMVPTKQAIHIEPSAKTYNIEIYNQKKEHREFL